MMGEGTLYVDTVKEASEISCCPREQVNSPVKKVKEESNVARMCHTFFTNMEQLKYMEKEEKVLHNFNWVFSICLWQTQRQWRYVIFRHWIIAFN